MTDFNSPQTKNGQASGKATPFKFDTPLEQARVLHCVHGENGFELSLLTSVSLLRLHSLEDADGLNQLLSDSGIVLPTRVNGSCGQDPSTLCLAPGEWLVFSEYLTTGLLKQQLAAAIDPSHTSLLDHSSAMAVFRLEGEAAPWLLGKLCGLNFHAGMTHGQHCARTRLDQAAAIIHFHQPGSGAGPYVYDVMMERSLARYGWQLFLDSLPHAHQLSHSHGP